MGRTVFVVASIFLLCLVLNVSADDDLNLQGLSERLPSDIADKIDVSALPKEEEAKKLFREKCRRNGGGDEAYEKAVTATDDLKTCVLSHINREQLQEEIEKAKPTGDLDMVFKKYCNKTPELKQCVFNFTATLEPCLDEQERENKRIIQNVANSLADFVCYKEGDRIALFIAEGGPECLQSKQEAIKNCFNSTLGKYAPTETPTIDNLPRLLLNAEQCQDIQNLQNCIVTELEACEEPTPANIVESLFKFIRKQTPCAPKAQSARSVGSEEEPRPSSASRSGVFFTTFIFGMSIRWL